MGQTRSKGEGQPALELDCLGLIRDLRTETLKCVPWLTVVCDAKKSGCSRQANDYRTTGPEHQRASFYRTSSYTSSALLPGNVTQGQPLAREGSGDIREEEKSHSGNGTAPREQGHKPNSYKSQRGKTRVAQLARDGPVFVLNPCPSFILLACPPGLPQSPAPLSGPPSSQSGPN